MSPSGLSPALLRKENSAVLIFSLVPISFFVWLALPEILGGKTTLDGLFIAGGGITGILVGSALQAVQATSFYQMTPNLHRRLYKQTQVLTILVLLLGVLLRWQLASVSSGPEAYRSPASWAIFTSLLCLALYIGILTPDPVSRFWTGLHGLALALLLGSESTVQSFLLAYPAASALVVSIGLGWCYYRRFSRRAVRLLGLGSVPFSIKDNETMREVPNPSPNALRRPLRYVTERRWFRSVRTSRDWLAAVTYENRGNWWRVAVRKNWGFALFLLLFGALFVLSGGFFMAVHWYILLATILTFFSVDRLPLNLSVLYPLSRRQRSELLPRLRRHIAFVLIVLPVFLLFAGGLLWSAISSSPLSAEFFVKPIASVAETQLVLATAALVLARPLDKWRQLAKRRSAQISERLYPWLTLGVIVFLMCLLFGSVVWLCAPLFEQLETLRPAQRISISLLFAALGFFTLDRVSADKAQEQLA